jgi:hypothetical protein
MMNELFIIELQLRTPINMLLLNLALADFFMASFGSPLPLIAAYQRGWPFGRTMCTIYGFGMALGGKFIFQFHLRSYPVHNLLKCILQLKRNIALND